MSETVLDRANDVAALHQVLRDELGDWAPSNNQEHQWWQQYLELAAEATRSRVLWLQARREPHTNPAECEKAYARMQQADDLCLAPLYRILHAQNRSALCFSGGGIRSATFCLGVLQALAKHSFEGDPDTAPPRLLTEFDYLSTVSGGGYIGSWFSSWITRDGGVENVARKLARTPDTRVDPDSEEVRHLRAYSNYLNPRLGLLSADTWTLVATTLRNILLNWFVLIPFLAAALLVPRLLRDFLAQSEPELNVLLWVGFGLGVLATAFIMHNLPSFGDRKKNETSFLLRCLVPLSLSAILMTAWWSWQEGAMARKFEGAHFALYGAAMHAAAVALGALLSLLSRSPNFRRGHFKWKLLFGAFLAALATGAAGGWMLSFVAAEFYFPRIDVNLYTCFALPLLMLTFGIVATLGVGISSNFTDDDDREWWARAGGWVLICAVTWTLFSSMVLLLPPLINYWSGRWQLGFTMVSAALGWYATHAGSSANTGPASRGDQSAEPRNIGLPGRLKRFLPSAAAILFLLALSFVVTLLNDWLCRLLYPYQAALLVLELAFAVVASYAVNVNKFSLHAMYRTRLIRAYLGASNPDRNPNPFTGFDPSDNLSMSSLSEGKPMHVVNMCLNLVRGSKLAWQQRKAESFTATRLYSGSFRVGYQPSATYAAGTTSEGITLGTAIAISGAAASPNMGYHSSPLAAIVMTLFNARLGWWLANPGEDGRRFWKVSGPKFGIRAFLDEAFGNTNDTNRYVYLSDGGHFENLGLYEMVLRRCRHIVVIDAGADSRYTFEDLGNAVRKIRIDLGVPIDFPSEMSIAAGSSPDNKHCAVGVIGYGCVDPGAEPGVLLYIKPVLNGNEPTDVKNYSSSNATFPHQATSDQWFDESQFESYRRLGAHSIEEIFGSKSGDYGVEDLINIARVYAYGGGAAAAAASGDRL